MKKIITGLLLLLNVTTQAQTDTHILDSAKKIMADYIPMGERGLLYKAYHISPDTFLHKLEVYKMQAYTLLDNSAATTSESLAKKEIDFYCRYQLRNYLVYYGTDSAKQEAFYTLLAGRNVSKGALDTARKAYRISSLTKEQYALLDSLCYKNIDMNDSALFIYSGVYRAYLSEVIQKMVYSDFKGDFMAGIDQSVIKLKVVNKFIHNAYIHSHFAYTFTDLVIKMSKDSLLKDSVYHSFMAQNVNPDYRSQIDSTYTNYLLFSNNKPAPDFNYTTVDGKQVSLKSLRGSYVYIDIWATWCGPCKKEIPYLSEIEEEYHGRNIRFVSLSVDVQKDKTQWQKYVLSNHLEGIQLIADNAFESSFIKKFNIAAIPRFILIDPKGMIISANASRPSDPALKTQLDRLVGKM